MEFLNQLKHEKIFWVGLLFKIICIVIFAPEIHNKWFLNFISFTIENFSLNPWNAFFNSGSDPMSYPYGPIMLILQVPLSFCGYIVDNLNFASQSKNYFLSLGFKSSILLADFLVLYLLIYLIKDKISKIIFFYWLSPIVIYICYWHGQLDIFPTLLLLLSLCFLKEKFYYFSAVTLGLSVACKLSVLISLPFIFLYLLLNNRYHKIVWKFIFIVILTIVSIQGPFFLTEGAQQMILNNPKVAIPFELSIPIVNNYKMPITFILLSILIFMTYKIGRMNFNLLYSCLGTAFFIILVFTPAPIGWYLWVVPFLVTFQISSNSKFFKYTILIFSLFFIFNKILIDEGSRIHFFKMDYYYLNKDLSTFLLSNIERISYEFVQYGTLMVLSLTGVILSFLMIRKNIFDNEFFKLIYKPISIGIAGDSAAGKDTLGKALGSVFGENSVASLNGDDYHLYERNSEKWKEMTHLNPKANNLKQFEKDCISLNKGNSIICREYNHDTGKFTHKKKIKKKDFILTIGLHALYPKKLRNFMDLSIYLDVEDDLRQYFKIVRDKKERNYKYLEIIRELKKRKKDSKLYIKKQKNYADIIFQISSTRKDILKKYKEKYWIDTKIKLIIKKKINKLVFLNTLSKIVKKFTHSETKREIIIELNSNDVLKKNFEFELKKITKDLDEILAISPEYKSKETGLMQFVVLFWIFDKIKNERI